MLSKTPEAVAGRRTQPASDRGVTPAVGDVLIEAMGNAFRLCRVVADPVALSLVGYGRTLERAALIAEKRHPNARRLFTEGNGEYRLLP